MLSNKVSEIMTTQVTSVPISSTVHEVMEIMIATDVGRIIIVANNVPIGIFTEKDILRRVANNKVDPKLTSIETVMTTPIRAVGEETHIVDAFGQMFSGQFRHLLVRNGSGDIFGIVSMRRILKIAVELGQGLSETRTLGSIASHGALSVDATLPVHQAIELMIERNVGAVVVTSASQPAGIFTERDVLKRMMTRGIDSRNTAIREVMTAPLVIMPGTALVGQVLAEMYRRDIRNMPVSGDQGELCGLVSMPDILQYARAFNINEEVRRAWKEIQNFYDSQDQYTPG